MMIKDLINRRHRTIAYLVFSILLVAICEKSYGQNFPEVDFRFKKASAITTENKLIVSTGDVERIFELTKAGMRTVSLKNLLTGKIYSNKNDNYLCDWEYYGLIDNSSKSELLNVSVQVENDERFTSEFLEVVSEFWYPKSKVKLKHVIWLYPEASGIRTQIFIKSSKKTFSKKYSAELIRNYSLSVRDTISAQTFDQSKKSEFQQAICEKIINKNSIPTGRVDRVPIDPEGYKRTYVGYFADTQHRNTPETPLIREETMEQPIIMKEVINWANFVAVHNHGEGVVMVKESHKCANQYGVDTGELVVSERGIQNTGTALLPSDFKPDTYSWCWASWVILFSGGQDGMELAIKEFDRVRYPVDESRDIYIQANTWGSDRKRDASKEENILIELESQQNLGIDIQQIDDGWQNSEYGMRDVYSSTNGFESNGDWSVRKDWYPEGWSKVVRKSKETKVKLGLWAAAMPIPLDDLKWHYDNGGFVTYKLDFAVLSSWEKIDDFIEKIRSFIKYTDHKVRVNWDLTEIFPRFGYYWAREYGCVYLENRKPKVPTNAIYIPHLVLRDVWQLSKYTNVNRFQTTIQNIDRVSKEYSDAYLYNHPYSVAIGLIGTPLFFQETQFYSKDAVEIIRSILKKYKNHRKEMYASYVYPIGNVPNNSNWTGFQWYSKDNGKGYLMVFRELHNLENQKDMQLRFLRNCSLNCEDIMSGDKFTIQCDINGYLKLDKIPPASYKFLKYEVINN